ncbi:MULTISPECIES: hypothetical protein [Pseudoalteromonas]|uniref:Uncharacterized protein n=1 Tax=Pseudoalteromonas maricaloris TaxID=184924 RepID=A0ABZ0MA63_9GAMM|nr:MULTISPECIES: hypothetical protein [Pseudoalteromonas]MBE0374804.1 hypothetical protein [Pseudoalteromonas flavipulchra NCIMB 2033 = ATCC BAA-314]MDP4489996.1 hypothetical protein [Pseudoalteromonas piscicida]QUI65198.1 hypothetical protein GSF04_23055 [Pseudoalteromonas sp. A22]WMO15337.1 hypothetical protein NI376_07055 [Pseudoalteromonas piscicida]WOX28665.1 hypothetical protein R5H13_18925 [Pseudoalteromonas maricaloris]
MLKLKFIKRNLKELNDKGHFNKSLTKKVVGGNTDGIVTTTHSVADPEPKL